MPTISLKVSNTERDEIRDRAQDAGSSISEWIRTRLSLDASAPVKPAQHNKGDAQTADQLRAEADRLTESQHKQRGYVPGPLVDGKPTQVLGPYLQTPESEARAARIIGLRRQAARPDNPS